MKLTGHNIGRLVVCTNCAQVFDWHRLGGMLFNTCPNCNTIMGGLIHLTDSRGKLHPIEDLYTLLEAAP